MGYNEVEERVRQRAHEIWEREGRPEGRNLEHWERAKEEIAIEDNLSQTLSPNPSTGPDDTVSHPEPVEPITSAEVQGEDVGPTAQSEEQPAPFERAPQSDESSDGSEQRGEDQEQEDATLVRRPRTGRSKTAR